jgi:hypothetical protein
VQVGLALPPAEQVAPLLVGPAVQATCAAEPAVQALVAAVPAVQSIGADSTPLPAEQVVGAPELPAVQAPDPLASSPKGTRIGDSYFDFALPFWSDI